MVTNSNCNDYNNKSLTNEFKKGNNKKSNTLFNSKLSSPYGSSFRKGSFAASFGGDTYKKSFGVSSDLETTTSNTESMCDSSSSSVILDSKMPSRHSKPQIKTISTRQSSGSNSIKNSGSVISTKSVIGSVSSALASTRQPTTVGSNLSSGPCPQSIYPMSTGSVSGYGSGYTSGSASGYTSGSPSGYTSGSASGYTSGSCSGYTSGSAYVPSSAIGSASGSASGSSSYNSVSATIAGAAPVKLPSSMSASNCPSGSALVSSSAVTSGSIRQSIVSGPINTGSTLRQQSAMGSGSLKQTTNNCESIQVSARPSAISAKSILSNISKTASSYKYDCGNSSEFVNTGSVIGKSPSVVSKKSESKNCGSVALPIFDPPLTAPKGCTASKTSLSGKSVTLNLDSRRPSKLSNKLGSCTSLTKSAFGSVKKSQSRTTLVSNAPSCKSNKSSSSKTDKNGFISDVENAILRSSDAPIDIKETEEIKALGNRGIWANKAEVMNWKGPVPICKYPINEDEEPQIIYKRVKQQLEYVQEMTIRYLRPPTPPEPGEIVIKLEPNKMTPPAPPIVIRQQPPKPVTPEPLIIREAPPPAPPCVGRKLII